MALSNPSSGTGYLYANPIISGLGCDSNYTMMAWARTSFPANSVMDIFGFVSGTGDYILTHFERSGSTRKIVCYNSSGATDGSTGLSADTWYHVAMVNAGGGSSSAPVVYLNGTSDITTSVAFPPNVTQMIIAGQPDYTEPLAGYVVAFKAWNTNLSAAEIAIEMNFWTAVRKANLIAEFPFGDIDALRLNNRVSAGNDLSEANTSVTFGDPGHPGIAWGFSNLPIIGVPSAGGATEITAAISSGASVVAALSKISGLVASIAGGGSVTASLNKIGSLVATVDSGGAVAATLVRVRPLTAGVASASDVAAVLSIQTEITADIASSNSVVATLSAVRGFVAGAAAASTTVATLSAIRSFTAGIAPGATVVANLTNVPGGTVDLTSDDIAAGATVVAVMVATRSLIAGVDPAASVVAALSLTRAITAGVAASSSVVASLLSTGASLKSCVAGIASTATMAARLTRLTSFLEGETFVIPGGGSTFTVPAGGNTFTIPA